VESWRRNGFHQQSVEQHTNLSSSTLTQTSSDKRFVRSRSKSANRTTQSIVQNCHVSCPTSGNKQVRCSRIPDKSEGILRHFKKVKSINTKLYQQLLHLCIHLSFGEINSILRIMR